MFLMAYFHTIPAVCILCKCSGCPISIYTFLFYCKITLNIEVDTSHDMRSYDNSVTGFRMTPTDLASLKKKRQFTIYTVQYSVNSKLVFHSEHSRGLFKKSNQFQAL